VHESRRERLESDIIAQLAIARAVQPSWHAETIPVPGIWTANRKNGAG
jgi:hypothetical protein